MRCLPASCLYFAGLYTFVDTSTQAVDHVKQPVTKHPILARCNSNTKFVELSLNSLPAATRLTLSASHGLIHCDLPGSEYPVEQLCTQHIIISEQTEQSHHVTGRPV